ncbi:ATP-dependent DNA helicase RecG [Helcococcus kunzii]|uniref:ATP-dependent DNA helicase RecG n=1 Tax=Helcococcus kunzii TaxID=40091 RepID=UPI0021A52098|nr:ATP-dependent DNA helicase RecG [Helcococcus kunzii]MCT1795562.1 ATP-dependent DNA helicase RecG [Helcococcus kunzii]MCT1989330.1 ATP-dependent DNA helicase RecG [Helcococcus kunzii]
MKLRAIKGIGPKKEEKLNELGIYTLDDLVNYFPKRYEDRSNKTKVVDAIDGNKAYFELTIKTQFRTYFYARNKSVSSLKAFDDTGEINIIWYNDRFSGKSLIANNVYKIYGVYNADKKAIINPIVSKINDDEIGGITPIYSVNKTISSKDIKKYINFIFDNNYKIDDYLDNKILEKENILSLSDTIYQLHKPENSISLYKAFYSINLRNVLIEHLSYKLLDRKKEDKYIKFSNYSLDNIINKLKFDLTDSQEKVIKEIFSDMTADKNMNRIIIGDVGSGKTIVAILSAILAIKNGYQVAFMAPTEILASQHYSNYRDFLEQNNIHSNLLLGNTSSSDKKKIYKGLNNGDIDIIFGTHSLFQDKISFNKLGLIIIDEQQRFGVYQRKRLFNKGENPDTLLLSATPIPRTLALALYKNLDISFMDALPKNRLAIKSYLTTIYKEQDFMNFAYHQIKEGRQVYVIASRVEEDEELESIKLLYNKLKKYFNNKIKIDYLHGKMSTEEKIEKQNLFVNNVTQMLIATSIVEVGVDVPNASTIIIYDAQQFGLSQLHQMRGRIGRGKYQSYCFFVVRDNKYLTDKLKFITDSLDGFEIAKKDLEIRGAGSIYGTEQSGNIDIENSFMINENLIETVNRISQNIDLEDKKIRELIDKNVEKLSKVILN